MELWGVISGNAITPKSMFGSNLRTEHGLRTQSAQAHPLRPWCCVRFSSWAVPGRDLGCLALNLDPAPANGSDEGRMILLGLLRISFAERRYGLVDDVALSHVTGHHCWIT